MSQSQTVNHIDITPIKAFSDNYIWAISTNQGSDLALVDPGDAKVCINYLEQHNKILSSILITHHHSDHTGGVRALIQYCQAKQWPLEVITPANNAIPGATRQVTAGDTVYLSNINLTLTVIELPGHTLDHLGYYNDQLLFCGDTLFSGGCGRLFEGTAAQMHASLAKLKQLPEHTAVYCTHEYTLANLEFALTVEPQNPELQNYYNHVAALRQQNKASLPTSIAREKQINPFLRTEFATIKTSAQKHSGQTCTDEVTVFAAIRQWKDNF